MKLTLLRHGDTAGSRDDLYYGAADIPVLPDSLEMLAERAKTGVYPTAARYYTSGLLRTERPSAHCTATYPTPSCRVCGRWTSAILR